MKSPFPLVYILILNYRTADDVLELVESLKSVTYDNFKTVVIDNASPDDSVAVLKRELPKDIELIAHNENGGFGAGNNVGIEHALKKNADYVLLLNPDTIVTPNFLAELISVAEGRVAIEGLQQDTRTGTIGIVGPRIYYYDTDKPAEEAMTDTVFFDGGVFDGPMMTGRHQNYIKHRDELTRTTPFACDYITGGAMLISRAVIERVGMMPVDYFLYYEDADYNARAHKKGFASVLVPSAEIWHKESRSTQKYSYLYLYYLTRNGYYFPIRHGSIGNKIVTYLMSIIKFVKQPIKWVLVPSKRTFVKPIMHATWDFWRGKVGAM